MKAIYSKTDKTGQKTPCRMTVGKDRVRTELYFKTIGEDEKVPAGWFDTMEKALKADKPAKKQAKKAE